MSRNEKVYVVESGSRPRIGNARYGCSGCGSPGNHCYDYCPNHNTVYTAAAFLAYQWEELVSA